jgi:hypothetical protein
LAGLRRFRALNRRAGSRMLTNPQVFDGSAEPPERATLDE